MSEPVSRSATWDELIDRFSDVVSMPCLRASGPDLARPKKSEVIRRLERQYAEVRSQLPSSPSDLTATELDVVLATRGLKDRQDGRRPSQTAFWTGLWRAIILDRDEYRCFFCRRSAIEGIDVYGHGRLALRMELDHVTPRSAGGKDYCLQNIRAVCRTCNTARSRMTDAHFRLELESIAKALTSNERTAI